MCFNGFTVRLVWANLGTWALSWTKPQKDRFNGCAVCHVVFSASKFMSATRKTRSRAPLGHVVAARLRQDATNSPSRWRWLLHLCPAVLITVMLAGMLFRDLSQEPPPPTVNVVIQPQPEEKIRPVKPSLP